MRVQPAIMMMLSVLGSFPAIATAQGHDERPGHPVKSVASPVAEPLAPASAPRLLDCSLGHITNFDRDKAQTMADYSFDGWHSFKLFLPATPPRTKQPPAATAAPEPVDPKTTIVSDPDRISDQAFGRPFGRVVDLWPERVEMTTPISDVAVNLIVIDHIDTAAATATLFLTHANDALTFDLKNLYIGKCKVAIGEGAAARS
ncbi:MAG TPA: hypothetical protein VF503_05975 [Sphingobium sp.]|uniref:hypothetical protein n=1 Tax=Sphingobium sp. TaxID=1912891 RepID=UPI002ED5F16A